MGSKQLDRGWKAAPTEFRDRRIDNLTNWLMTANPNGRVWAEMKYFRRKSRAQGFTLLEVLVAVAILAIAMVAILKANVQSLDALTKSRETSTASLLAASKLAEIEAVGAASWVEMQGDFGKDHPDYTWEVESTRSELEGVMRVAVIVQRSKWGVADAVRIEELLLTEQLAVGSKQ